MNLDVAENPDAEPLQLSDLELEDRWLLDGLNRTIEAVTRGLEQYEPSNAIGAARDWFWGSLCDWYLELIKPRLQDPDSASARVARAVLAYALDQVLRLLHPFVPFITEYLWGRLGEIGPPRGLSDETQLEVPLHLISAPWPVSNPAFDQPELPGTFAALQQITRAVREVRASAGVGPRQPLEVTVKTSAEQATALGPNFHVVERLAAVSRVTFDAHAARRPGSAVAVLGDTLLFVHDVIDDEAERGRLTKERGKLLKEVQGTEKRLNNPNFVAKAPPEVVDEIRERLRSYRDRLAAVERSLEQLG